MMTVDITQLVDECLCIWGGYDASCRRFVDVFCPKCISNVQTTYI